MNLLERTLYKTRKTVLEACREIDVQYPPEDDIGLESCSCCGVWLISMKRDLDSSPICDICLDTYGA